MEVVLVRMLLATKHGKMIVAGDSTKTSVRELPVTAILTIDALTVVCGTMAFTTVEKG